MKKFIISRKKSLAFSICLSVLVMLITWLISPELASIGQVRSPVFDAVWETVNANFYDPKFNGVNWQEMREKYEPQVTKAQSKEEAAFTINRMLSELKTSHTRFYTANEPAYYQVLGIFAPRVPRFQQQLKNYFPNGKIEYSGIGIFTKNSNGKTFVSAILDGSPAEKAGLMVGDELLSVDDRPFHPIQSFAGKAGQQVTIKIQRELNPNSQKEIIVTPKMLDGITMFMDAMDASVETIEREGKKLGYVHIWSYASDQYQQKLEEELFYGRLRNADALILDLREGWGGAPLSAINIYTAKGPTITTIGRDGVRGKDIGHWNKPVVMLVNEGSRSAKEILAYSFQQYDIGPVVGAKTAGAVVAGRAFLMPDGSLLYLAVADVYVDGNLRLEGKGVTPDVVVPFSPEYAKGADPQKERAVEITLAAVKAAKN